MSKASRLLHQAKRLVFLWVLKFGLLAGPLPASDILPPGFRPLPLGVHALVGGRVVIKPGELLEEGTIVIRDGLIKAVGRDVPLPADARIWDMKGMTVYAGFIDPYLVVKATNVPAATSDVEPASAASLTSGGFKFFGAPGAQTDMGKPGPGAPVARIRPEYRSVADYSPKDKILAPPRALF